MKLVVLLAVLSVATLALPSAHAAASAPVCVGYQDCYEQAHDGFAILCVKDPKNSARWICFECESCGNGPWLP